MSSPWLVGLQAARANFWPGLCLQAVMLLLVFAYYRVDWTKPLFTELAFLKLKGGFLFSMFSAVIAGALLPELLVVLFFQQGKFTKQTRTNLVFGAIFWFVMGFVVDLFYRGQNLWFGTEPNASTLMKKVLVDQFVYTPLFANPATVWCYEWKSRGFSIGRPEEFFTREFYVRHMVPTLIANWGVWLPSVALIYCLPPLLQTPLFSLALTFWAMMLAYISSTPSHRQIEAQPHP